jgi:hypothetical protein
MSNKTIEQLTAKTPVSTDLIPVADPTTGIAGKSTIFNLLSSGNSFKNLPFSSTPSADSLIYYGLQKNHIKGISSVVLPEIFGGWEYGTNTAFNYLYDGLNFSESDVTSIVLNEKELFNYQSANSFSNFVKVQSISAPNLTVGYLNFGQLYSLQNVNFPVLSSGYVSFTSGSAYNFTGTFNPLPAFKNGTIVVQNFGTQASSAIFPELENADYFIFQFNSGQYRAPNLITLSLPKLKRATLFSVQHCQALTNISLPELLVVSQSFDFNPQFVQTASFPKLEIAISVVNNTYSFLTTLNLPSLRTIINSFGSSTNQCPLLTTINLPELVYAGFPVINANSTSTGTVYAFLNGNHFINFTSTSAIQTINLPKLKFMTSTSANVSINITAASGLTTVTLNQTPKFYGGNITITGAALNQASVDGILVACAYQDGVANAPYPAYSSRTINLSGGTSSTPSATGLAAKATLVARGCTVTHN